MLLELNIRDFAIIERLSLRMGEGFNVLTGETGAGKSIIIDALGTLRGDRTDPAFVRAGADRARVEGIFSVADRQDVIPILEEYGLWDVEDEQVILSREISGESGRSVARVNGRAVNSAVLREIGGRLVDIHGQHEGLSLFNTRTHGEMLDRYGGLISLRDRFAAKIGELRRVREDLAALRKAAASRTERIEDLRLLLEDVGAAKLRPGEEAALLQERALVQNSARITELVAAAYTLLYAGDESGRRPVRPIVEQLSAVNDALSELSRIDPGMARAAEQSSELLYVAEDLAASVRAYRDAMEFDPARLDQIEDRLTLIRDLQRKYHGSIEQILEHAASAEAEIARLAHSDEHMAELQAEETRLLQEAGVIASELNRRRCEVGEQLAQAVEGAMRELAMPHVHFSVAIEHNDDPQGVPVRTQPSAGPAGSATEARLRRLAFDKTGVDKIEFLLSPNPGEPLKPLARIASGGESARLLLALKSILSRVDEVPTLVFDEVDIGVGGRAGQVVGEKLWGISEQHQVICITHLAQVAAFADTHFTIAKLFSADRTRTVVQRLTDEQRVEELAAMLDGTPISEHSRRAGQEMLDRAHLAKTKASRGARQPALVRP